MRYPDTHKAETRERIIGMAATSFREKGNFGQGIAGLMSNLGLTIGGFYKHFSSKDELYVEALTRGFEETARQAAAVAASAPDGLKLQAIIKWYLSSGHLNDTGNGCVLAALGPEIGRLQPELQGKINRSMQRYVDSLLPLMPGNSPDEQRMNFFILIPGMAGALMTARAIAAPRMRSKILRAAREFYLHAFAGKTAR
jgi:TetR/AcrR family transcriptional repressor of nem operon